MDGTRIVTFHVEGIPWWVELYILQESLVPFVVDLQGYVVVYMHCDSLTCAVPRR